MIELESEPEAKPILQTILRDDLYSSFINACKQEGFYPGQAIRRIVNEWIDSLNKDKQDKQDKIKKEPINGAKRLDVGGSLDGQSTPVSVHSEFQITGSSVVLVQSPISKKKTVPNPQNNNEPNRIGQGLKNLKLPQSIIDAMLKAASEKK